MKINIVCIDKIKKKFFKDAAQEYEKRLSRFCKLSIIEKKAFRNTDKNKSMILKVSENESAQLFEACSGYKILADIEGDLINSVDIANIIKKLSNDGISNISFIIGGSHGVSQEYKKQADKRISFGLCTFPHELVRVMLLEQIYRAFCIINNIEYHK